MKVKAFDLDPVVFGSEGRRVIRIVLGFGEPFSGEESLNYDLVYVHEEIGVVFLLGVIKRTKMREARGVG